MRGNGAWGAQLAGPRIPAALLGGRRPAFGLVAGLVKGNADHGAFAGRVAGERSPAAIVGHVHEQAPSLRVAIVQMQEQLGVGQRNGCVNALRFDSEEGFFVIGRIVGDEKGLSRGNGRGFEDEHHLVLVAAAVGQGPAGYVNR